MMERIKMKLVGADDTIWVWTIVGRAQWFGWEGSRSIHERVSNLMMLIFEDISHITWLKEMNDPPQWFINSKQTQ